MSSESPAIIAEGLGKVYSLYNRPVDRLKQWVWGGRRQYARQFTALSGVSFSLPRGRVLGLVGNNGAGKSTLLQMVCGTLAPTTGCLQVNGRVAALLELGAGFNPEFSGRENIFLNGAVLGISQREIEKRFDAIVEFSGIGDFIDQPVKTYSSGMYVRLAFSIATSVEPDILVIDEALSVGDGPFARKSFDRIMELKDGGTTILFCSHSMYHIEAICDTALWLEKGHVMMLDVPEKVVRAYGASQELAGLAGHPSQNALPQPVPSAPSSRNARILSIAADVDGVSGRRLVVRSGMSELRIEVAFQSDPALPPPSLAFGLETSSGQSVSSGSSVFDHVVSPLDSSGKGRFSLRFPSLPLMRGIYRITLFLACERAIHVYDHALYCIELEVIHPGIEQGVVFLPHAWNEGGVVLAPGDA